MGKSKCCCCNNFVPHPKFMNLTVEPGFQIPDDETKVLFRDVQSSEYCIFGPLQDWFDLETGEFTVKETGLYAITVIATFAVDTGEGFEPSQGERLVRVKRTYGSPRCNGNSQEISFLGLTQSNINDGESSEEESCLTNNLMTFNAYQPLAVEDKLEFLVCQNNPGQDTAMLYFELHIAKISPASIEIFDPVSIQTN